MSFHQSRTDFPIKASLNNHEFYYLAGPMQGVELYNFPKFFKVARQLREEGIIVFNPAEFDMSCGFDPGKTLEEQGYSLKEAFRVDLRELGLSNGLILMEGWKDSEGCKREFAFAMWIGLPIYFHMEGAFPCIVQIPEELCMQAEPTVLLNGELEPLELKIM